MAEHQLSQLDDGAVVNARVGDVIEIRLSETASSGYRWEPGSASDLMEPAAPGYDFAADKVGGVSTAHFRFTVKRAGCSEIRLQYQRPWEKSEPPSRTFVVTIIAE